MQNIKLFPTLTVAASALADELGKIIATSKEKIVLTLPGGLTPAALFSELTARDINWQKVIVSLSDERYVPTTSKDSNEHSIKTLMLDNINNPPAFVPLVTDLSDEANNRSLAEHRIRDISSYPNIAVIGMGTDEHITSLFTAADTQNTGILCSTMAPNGMHRISLTMEQLLKSQKIYLLIAGSQKKEIIYKIISHDTGSPASKLIRLAGDKIVVYCSET